MSDTNREAGKPGISRGAQTAWIVGAIAAVGLVYAYYETRLPATNPYSQCQFLFWDDSSCAGEVAADRIMGGDGWGPARDRLSEKIKTDLAEIDSEPSAYPAEEAMTASEAAAAMAAKASAAAKAAAAEAAAARE